MSGEPEAFLARCRELLEELKACDQEHERVELADGARAALLDARRGRAHPEALRLLLLEICAVTGTDVHPSVRATAAGAVEDMCLRDLHAFIVDGTPVLSKGLEDPSTIVVLRSMRTITALFRRVMGLASFCGVGLVPAWPGELNPLPEECYRAWLDIRNRVMSLVHHVHDGISKGAVKFAETVVLALSYSGTSSLGSQEHFTLDFARSRSSLSPALDLEALESDGRRTVEEIAGIVLRPIGGTQLEQSAMIRPNPYITALTVLGNLSRRRKLLLEATLPPLLLAASCFVDVQATGRSVLALSKGQRSSAVMVIRLSLQALRSYPHVRSPPIAQAIADACTALSRFEANEYGASLQLKREEHETCFTDQSSKGTTNNAKDAHMLLKTVAASEQKPVKRLRSGLSKEYNPTLDLPPAQLAASAARLYGQVMPPPQLIDFIITHLLCAPLSWVGDKMTGDRRAEKRARADAQESVQEGTGKEQEVASAVRRTQVRKLNAPRVVASCISGKVRLRLIQMHCRRVLQNGKKIAATGASSLRMLLLGRLLRLATDKGVANELQFVQEIIDFIVADFGGRLELGLAWLHVEAVRGLLIEAKGMSLEDASDRPKMVHPAPDEECIEPCASRLAPDVPNGCSLSQTSFEGTKIRLDPTVESPKVSTPAVEGDAETSLNNETMLKDNSDSCLNQVISEDLIAVGEVRNMALRDVDGAMGQIQRSLEGSDELSEDSRVLARFAAGSNYDILLSRMLKSASERLGPEDRLLSRLVVEAPALTDGAIDIVIAHCRDAARSRLGLSTLRDIIVERPGPDRDRCLEILLGFTTDQDDVLRGPAIRLVASKLFEDMSGAVPEAIETFALNAVKHALEQRTKIVSYEEYRDTDVSLYGTLERNLWLLSALCVKKNALLVELAKFYIGAPASAKKIFSSRAKDIAGQIGPSSPAVIALVRGEDNEYARNIEELGDLVLVLTSASIGRNGGQIPPELVAAVRVRYGNTKDARFLREILTGLNRNEIVQYLDVLISMGTTGNGNQTDSTLSLVPSDVPHSNGFKAVVREIMGARSRPISPTDLIVELHVAQISTEICAALKTCLELRVIFKETDIACALQKLMAMDSLPDLLMRTVLLTHIYHPSLDQFVRETVMMGLIRRKCWCNKLLWTGFLQYCAETTGSSLGLLASLPLPQLVDILSKQHGMQKVISKLLNAKEIRLRRTVRSHFAAALLQTKA